MLAALNHDPQVNASFYELESPRSDGTLGYFGEKLLIGVLILSRNLALLRADSLWREGTELFLSRIALAHGRARPVLRGEPAGWGPMAYTLNFLADLSIAGALVGCAHTLFASVVVLRYRPVRRAGLTSYPPVTILKPLDGAEPDLFTRLASFCTQDYPGPIEIICGVQPSSDPSDRSGATAAGALRRRADHDSN